MVALAMVMLSSSAMADVCVWGTACGAGTDQTAVLIGGVGGTVEAADPNTLPIICTRINSDCFYLSNTTGWWASTSTNTTDTTVWKVMAAVP